jgi:hypothetical protein
LIATILALFVANTAHAQTPVTKDGTENTSKTRASVTTPSSNAPQTGGAKQQETPAKK